MAILPGSVLNPDVYPQLRHESQQRSSRQRPKVEKIKRESLNSDYTQGCREAGKEREKVRHQLESYNIIHHKTQCHQRPVFVGKPYSNHAVVGKSLASFKPTPRPTKKDREPSRREEKKENIDNNRNTDRKSETSKSTCQTSSSSTSTSRSSQSHASKHRHHQEDYRQSKKHCEKQNSEIRRREQNVIERPQEVERQTKHTTKKSAREHKEPEEVDQRQTHTQRSARQRSKEPGQESSRSKEYTKGKGDNRLTHPQTESTRFESTRLSHPFTESTGLSDEYEQFSKKKVKSVSNSSVSQSERLSKKSRDEKETNGQVNLRDFVSGVSVAIDPRLTEPIRSDDASKKSKSSSSSGKRRRRSTTHPSKHHVHRVAKDGITPREPRSTEHKKTLEEADLFYKNGKLPESCCDIRGAQTKSGDCNHFAARKWKEIPDENGIKFANIVVERADPHDNDFARNPIVDRCVEGKHQGRGKKMDAKLGIDHHLYEKVLPRRNYKLNLNSTDKTSRECSPSGGHATGCICELCVCGYHECPKRRERQAPVKVPFDGKPNYLDEYRPYAIDELDPNPAFKHNLKSKLWEDETKVLGDTQYKDHYVKWSLDDPVRIQAKKPFKKVPFQGESVYKSDFVKKDREDPYDLPRYRNDWAPKGGFEDGTTYRADFVEKEPDLEHPRPRREPDLALPFEGKSEYKDKFPEHETKGREKPDLNAHKSTGNWVEGDGKRVWDTNYDDQYVQKDGEPVYRMRPAAWKPTHCPTGTTLYQDDFLGEKGPATEQMPNLHHCRSEIFPRGEFQGDTTFNGTIGYTSKMVHCCPAGVLTSMYPVEGVPPHPREHVYFDDKTKEWY